MTNLCDKIKSLFNKKENSTRDYVQVYFKLKKEFQLSHKELSRLLGFDINVVNDWLTESLQEEVVIKKIKSRINYLEYLVDRMDKEHKPHLYKYALSPIDGNPEFSLLITKTQSGKALLDFYNNKAYGQLDFLSRLPKKE